MAHETARPTSAVVFVNFRSESMIEARAPIFAEEGFHVTVVDNSGSYPLSREDVVVIDPGSNLGFGRACNMGVGSLPREVETVVLHNPDVNVTPTRVKSLICELWKQQRPGLLAPAERQGALLRRTGYHYPSLPREAALALRTIAHGPSIAAPGVRTRRTASVSGWRFGSGALLVAARNAYEAIGGFDERYFLYAEDLDLWHRMAERYDVAFSSQVAVDHVGGSGSDATASSRELLRWMGVELFAELHGSPARWRAYRAVHRLALAEILDTAPPWAELLAAQWRLRARPSEVQARLQTALSLRADGPSPSSSRFSTERSGEAPGQEPTTLRISVVIPCHNYGRFVREAFESVRNQTRPPDEVVLVDDGSTDETAEVLAEIERDHPWVQTLSRWPAQGVVRTMNEAVGMTSGDLVVRLDADDRLSPRYLEVLEPIFHSPGVGFGYTPEKLFGERTGWNYRTWSVKEHARQNLVNASAMFRRSLFDQVGGLSSRFERLSMEDWELWLKFVKHGAEARYVDDGAYLEYRQHRTGNRNATRFSTAVIAHLTAWWIHRPLIRLSDVGIWLTRVLAGNVRRLLSRSS